MDKKTTTSRRKSENRTTPTAGGAQQWDRNNSAAGPSNDTNFRLTNAMRRDLVDLGPRAFEDKHGVSYRKAQALLDAADSARNSRSIRNIAGRRNSTTDMYDSFEARAQSRARGYNKGGMVKANCGASVKPNGKARK